MHIKALDAVVASVRTRIDQGDCPVEQVQGVEILEEAVVQLADRLDGLEWNGCLTGDCPHETQAECDKHLADELRRTFSVPAIAAPSSSAEPAPPTKKCSECQTSLNEGEGKCFTVCDQCWDKTYRTISGAEKSSALPVQEEAPTFTGTVKCPVCGSDEPHWHDAATVGRAIAEGADLPAIPVTALIDGREKDVGKLRDILHRAAMDLFRRGLDNPQIDAGNQTYREGLDLHDLADALPALLEASRRDQQTAKALEATNIGGIMDIFTDPADALTQMALHIRDLEARLSGSISERETLTAQIAELQKMLEQERRAHGG